MKEVHTLHLLYLFYCNANKKLALKSHFTRVLNSYEKLNYIKEKPCSRPFVHDKFLSSLGIRSIKVKNYIVFYYIEDNKNKKFVNLVSFMYNKRDWANILKEIYQK